MDRNRLPKELTISRYRFVVGLAAIAAVGPSCSTGDVIPTVLPDPAGMATLIGQYREATNTPAMQSLGALALPLVAFGADAGTLAGVLRGKTIEWNVTTDVLDTTARTGAPANATRVILYSINPLTRRPVEPLVEVGHVDLFAHSDFPDSASIRYLVSDSSAAPIVLADFLAHAHDAPTNDTARVQGFVTNGTRRLNFAFPYRYQSTTHSTLSAFFDMVAPATRLGHVSALPKPGDSTLATSITFEFEGDSIESISYLTAAASGINGTQEVGVNGIGFARSTITGPTTVPVGPAGRELTADERAAVDAMHALAVELALLVEWPVHTIFSWGLF